MFFLHNGNMRQWRKWFFVSIVWPQQIGFKQSWKCLNLWSATWLKPSLIPVSSFKPSKFWVEEIIFCSGLINFNIRLLNIWHKAKLRILISRLFHSAHNCWEKGFFWKISFYIEKRIVIGKSPSWSLWVVVFWY